EAPIMATIAATSLNSIAPVTVTETTLTGTDTFVYDPTKTQYLILRNDTAGALTPNIDGDGATTQYALGIGNVDLTGGYTFASIAAGATVVVDLADIKAYLAGTISMTGGTGIVASLLEA
ncbi:hypothetical protein, partial [Herbaspirillum sp.]|uniref:hypothetical protein n=1 Tax=Herbaspirillum sp. TaxID=1890675 RepID=UPI00258A36F1